MSLTRIGPYTILGELGRGGMGTVYRARDTRLRRDVALKVLPDDLRLSPERLARFEHEARVVAALNHPNVAAIYGIEDGEAGVLALVLELVEGKTLATRIAEGRLSVVEALDIARQIAQALDAAHEKGIVHRDLKPANIVITPTGLVKVLDFGLAKMIDASESAVEDAVTAGLTREGVVVGTPAYMSPEQARGQVVDKRTDIWAFGCVLYEMLTGHRPFAGGTVSETIATLQTTDPDWSRLPPQVPAVISALLKRCLERERPKRLADVAAVRFALEDAAASGDQPDASMSGVTRIGGRAARSRVAAVGAAVVLVAAVVLIAAARRGLWDSESSNAQSTPVRLTIPLPRGQRLAALGRPSIALSPDGSQLAYVATTQGEDARQIYLYSFEREEAQPLSGTEGASNPFFSPDGQWLGYYSRDILLMKIPVRGGAAPQQLTTVTIPLGASWSSQHTIAFTPYTSVIQQVSEDGGTPRPLTRFENGETEHVLPEFLPGGKAFVFTTVSIDGTSLIAVQPIGASERRNVPGHQGTMPRYAPSGQLVYAQRGKLMAVAFDLGRLETKRGDIAVEVVGGVSQSGSAAQFSLSTTGSLAYVPGNVQAAEHTLVWVSRNGTEQPLPGAPPRFYNQPRISPNGQRMLVDVIEGSLQVWQYDFARSQLIPFTYGDDGENRHGVWQPDSKRVVVMSKPRDATQTQLFRQSADGGGLEQLTNLPHTPTADVLPIPYSYCGHALTFVKLAATPEMWTLEMGDLPAGSRERPARRLSFRFAVDGGPQLSPDCRWLAYASDESGRREIFVRSFPDLENMRRISMDGGNEPLWNPNPNKRELFYRNGDRMMAVEITAQGVAEGKARELFPGNYATTRNGFVRANYDVSPDGERFLMLKPVEREPLTQIKVVLNWHEELKRLVPAD